MVLQPAGTGIAYHEGEQTCCPARKHGDADSYDYQEVGPGRAPQPLESLPGGVGQKIDQCEEQYHPDGQYDHPSGPAYGGKQACNQESGPHQHQNAKSPGTPQVRQGQPRLDGGLGPPLPAVVEQQACQRQHQQRQVGCGRQ